MIAITPYSIFKKILYCTDFSINAERAFEFACSLAAGEDSTLFLMNVVVPFHLMGVPDGAIPSEVEVIEQSRQESEKRLQTEYEDLCGKNVRARKIVRAGREYQEIISFAKEEKVDLIVVGTHGNTGMGHVLLGSVAEKVVQNSTIPVLVIPS